MSMPRRDMRTMIPEKVKDAVSLYVAGRAPIHIERRALTWRTHFAVSDGLVPEGQIVDRIWSDPGLYKCVDLIFLDGKLLADYSEQEVDPALASIAENTSGGADDSIKEKV